MEREERFFHECPECGLLTPWLQRKCDCGYRFKRRLPPDRRLVALIVVLAVLLAGAAGYILSGIEKAQPVVAESAVAPTPTPAPTRAPVSTVAPTITPFPTFAPRVSLPPLSGSSALPQPVLVSNGEIVKDTSLEQLAPLTVETSGVKSYYVFLKCLSVSGAGFHLPSAGDMSFYVTSGQSAEVLVPLGEYEVYYATGETWYGPEIKFGSGTEYFKCGKTLSFVETLSGYSGWTMTLYPVYNGNLETETLTAAEFPE